MSKKFDYKNYAKETSRLASKALPPEIKDKDKKFITKIIYNFSIKAGEALVMEENSLLSPDDIQTIIQYIAEWTFHKAQELIDLEIASDLWPQTLNIVAGGVFESGKDSLIGKLDKETTRVNIEKEAESHFKHAISLLKAKGLIKKEKLAIKEDNLNEKDPESTLNKEPGKINKSKNKCDPKFKKLNFNDKYRCYVETGCKHYLFTKRRYIFYVATITQITGIVISVIMLFGMLLAFLNYIVSLNNIFLLQALAIVICLFLVDWSFKHISKDVKKLEQVKKEIKELINPDRMFEHMGVDKVKLYLSFDLISIADPEQNGKLMAKIAVLRQKCMVELGYILPIIRLQDHSRLSSNEYAICIRDNIVAKGIVYPKMFAINLSDWEKTGQCIPFGCKTSFNPVYKNKVIWVDSIRIPENMMLEATNAQDFIINHIKDVLIKNIDLVLNLEEVEKLLNHVRKVNNNLIDDILKEISPVVIREILVYLIREKVSIKDIVFVFEKILYVLKIEKVNDPVEIVERLRVKLSDQICYKLSDETNELQVATLCTEWEKILEDSLQNTQPGKMFNLSPVQVAELVELTEGILMENKDVLGNMPVILCSQEIRLPLYDLLGKHIPDISVLSYSELISNVEVNQVATIGSEFV